MAALREILTKFGFEFDDKQLKKGESGIDGMIGKVKDLAGALGAGLALGAIKDFISELVEQADQLGDTSTALGISAQVLQEFRHAADLGGSSADAVTGALKRLSKEANPEALRALNIEAKNAQGELKSAPELFTEIADGIKGIKNPSERSAIAAKFFGKQFTDLMPLLLEGGDGIAKLRAEFHELGGGFDDDFIEQAASVKDESDRIGVVWRSLKISVVSQLLPSIRSALTLFLSFAKAALRVQKAFAGWVKHSKLAEAAFGALAVRGVMFLSSKIGPLGAAFRRLGAFVLRAVLPLLIFEDLLVFLAGGDSLIQRIIDGIFGPGSSDHVRGFITEVKDAVIGFIDDLTHRPLKLIDDWKLFVDVLSAEVEELFGPFFGGWVRAAGEIFGIQLDLMLGGWDNFVKKTSATWDALKLLFETVWTEIKFAALGVAAAISDRFDGVWNSIIGGAQNALGVVRSVLAALPGTGEIVQGLDQTIRDLAGAKTTPEAVETISRLHDQERLGIARKAETIAGRLGGSAADAGGNARGAAPPTTNIEVNVTVPAGMPAETARRVGNAAAAGAVRGARGRAAQAALTPKPRG